MICTQTITKPRAGIVVEIDIHSLDVRDIWSHFRLIPVENRLLLTSVS